MSQPSRFSLPPGASFAGRFVIRRLIGQGSMARVYEAERLADGASVAVKVCRADDPGPRRRFSREAEVGKQLVSPHVARVLEAGDDPASGQPYIVFELVRGPTLGEYLNEHPQLSRDDALALLRGLGEALRVAHANGIVHRDLSPDNLRVDERDGAPHLVVLDFGVAKAFADLSGTAPGLGAPLWVAPEQGHAGYQPVPSADVWAYGLLAFYVLTGRFYWRHAGDGSSIAELALELLRGPLEPPSVRARALGVTRTLPPGFDAWFARAVTRDPGARFTDAGEATDALVRAFDAPRAPAADRGGPVVERPGWLLLLLAIGLALMGYALARIVRG